MNIVIYGICCKRIGMMGWKVDIGDGFVVGLEGMFNGFRWWIIVFV